jgi:hypothetical protein
MKIQSTQLISSSEPGLTVTYNMWLASLAENRRSKSKLRLNEGPQTLSRRLGAPMGRKIGVSALSDFNR